MKTVKLVDNIAIYKQANPENVMIKLDYVNKHNKNNDLLASLLINDEECSVRFNGYIIVKCEF